jgi:hypothetical protein
MYFNALGGSSGELTISRYNTEPFSSASPVFATNTSAQTNNFSIFTPNNVSKTNWYAITYSGIGTAVSPNAIEFNVTINTTNVPGITSPDSLYVIRRSDYNGSWNAVTSNYSTNSLFTGFINGFRDYSIGSQTSVNALPVKWLSIKAVKTDYGYHDISWETASEINNDYFIVQYSSNGSDFNDLGRLSSGKFPMQKQFYSFKDEANFGASNSFYRIKQVDYDGLESFSKIVQLENEDITQNLEISMSNPFSTYPLIWINQAAIGTENTVNVYSLSGEKLLQKTIIMSAINEQFELKEMENLNSGIYLVEVENNGMSVYRDKLIKMNK